MVVKNGYKQTEVGVIPEDWEVMKFEDLTDKIIGGGTPSRSNPSFWGNEIPWVTVKDFATFNPFITQEYITKEGLQNSASHLIPKGIIITSTRMALGKAVIYDVDVSINQDLKAIYPKRIIDTKFFYYWFQFNAKYIEDMGSGSTVMGLSLPDLRKIKVKIPTLAEQTAIATCLSDADSLITSLEKLIAKKRNIKQGAMQQLLQPKDGWKVKTLGDYVKITSGESPSKFDFKPLGIPYFKVEQLNNSEKYQIDTPYYIETVNTIPKGSIIFPKRGASILLNKVRILKSDSYMDTNLMTLTLSEELDSEFIYYMLIYIELWRIADTTSIPQINNKHINPIEIPFPPKKEQTRIATILSDMDAELKALEQKLEKYKKIKLGMMQELLTGKTRLV